MPATRFWSAILLLSVTACAQPLERVLEQVSAVRRFEEVAISPDGARIAWAEQDGSAFVSDWKTRSKPRPLAVVQGRPCGARSLAFSPEGSRIAFLSACGASGPRQLYVVPAAGGVARKLTDLAGFLADAGWSPDGRAVAFLYTENAGRAVGPLEAVGPRTGEIEEHIVNQRLAVLDAGSGALRVVSPAGLNVYEYDWKPDGEGFVLTAAPGPGDDNWYIAQIYVLALEGSEMRTLFRPSFQVAAPRWSPDGKSIAFIGGLMSDEGFTGGDIYTIDAAGGAPRNRTEGRTSSPNWVAWLSPQKLFFTEHAGGGSAISILDPGAGRAETLWNGEEPVSGGGNYADFAISRNAADSVLIRQSWARPQEVWAGAPGHWRQITNQNRDAKPAWGPAKSLEWTNDGFRVQAWLVYPSEFDPARKYPLLVDVHGGPAGVRKPSWPRLSFDPVLLASQGYFVLLPNPRGSHGQGEAFTRANVKDFGGGDLRDILAGVEEAIRAAPIDTARVGITGWSYGGYMSMFAVTQTNRFRAAVAGAGIANWQSYYGQNSIDQWMIPYFGASVYDDPAVYAKSSPITFIKNVKTPTLVLVGEQDGECPPPQSFEFWHALKALGVNTRLVVYPEEGHAFRSRDNQRDVLRRAAAWFDQYLKPSAASASQ